MNLIPIPATALDTAPCLTCLDLELHRKVADFSGAADEAAAWDGAWILHQLDHERGAW